VTALHLVKKIPRLLWSLKMYYYFHKIPPLYTILSKLNPFYTLASYYFKINSNIIVLCLLFLSLGVST
jgi:hypothetical protein